MDFTKENLIKFEQDYFQHNKYPNLRYGQAINSIFNFDVLFGENIYYEENDSDARRVVWMVFEENK